MMFAYIEGMLEPEEKKIFELHLQGCNSCREELQKTKKLVDMLKEIRFRPNMVTEDCKNYDVVGYAFDELTPEERETTAMHIAKCDHCLFEVIDLKAIKKNDVDVDNSQAQTPDAIKANLYGNWINHNIIEFISDSVDLKLPLAAGPAGFKKTRKVGNRYMISISPKNGEISLMKEDACHSVLKPVRDIINGHYFYYKIFGLVKDLKQCELLSGKERFLPITIKLPTRDLSALYIFISQREDVIQQITLDWMLNVAKGTLQQPINEVIYIYAKICWEVMK
ncbi:MAG: zf-HC2 domain-containing protein [Candidatus Brocadia sp.]|nr:MAG: zf-HC2 domain-containing protein [Candidatus Brocadia sp.]